MFTLSISSISESVPSISCSLCNRTAGEHLSIAAKCFPSLAGGADGGGGGLPWPHPSTKVESHNP